MTLLLRFIVFASLGLLARGAGAQPAPPRPAAPEYVPNRGQWPAAVQLRADVAPGLRVYAEAGRLLWLRYDAAAWAARAHATSHGEVLPANAPPVAAHAWAVEFVGATPGAVAQPEGTPTGPVRNYLLGTDARRWATGLRSTTAARYPALWPGIDLHLHAAPDGAFEYDLLVQPGADPARAVLRYRGLHSLRLDAATGHLRLRTALGELREAAPVAWQPDGYGGRRAVPVQFVLKPEATGRARVSFAFPRGYDRTRPLTVDPVLVFATHSGSTSPVFGHTATYDNLGHLYAAGPCFDPGYPTTLGAYDLTHSNDTTQQGYANPDVAISRYAPDGHTLRYATYLGGHEADVPHSLLVNNRGELLILGTTLSADFPTTPGAFARQYGQGYDLFVARLDSTGSQLLSSTYLGGQADDGYTPPALHFFYGDDYRGDLAVDSLDRVYVATTTASPDFPFTAGAVRPAAGFTQAAVVARFSADLTRLEWAAGLGAEASAYGLHLPRSGAPYVVGTTRSAGLPTTAGTLTPDSTTGPATRQRDGFIVQLSPGADSVRAGTYLRATTTGRPSAQTFFVQGIPGSTDVAVLGSSTGAYPISAGRWGQAGGGLVLQRLAPDLRQRRWSTTIGHPVTVAGTNGVVSDNLAPTAFLVDRCGALYLSAWGNTTALATTTNALQRTTDGQDLYMLVLRPDAAGLEYATYLGGHAANNWAEEHVDGGTSRFDPQGRIYQAICTNSPNFPTTPTSWSPTIQVTNAQYDEVSVKLDFERRLVHAVATAADTTGGAPARLTAPATVQFGNRSTAFTGTTYQWNFGDGGAPSSAVAPRHTYLRAGTFVATLIVRDPGSCAGADTTHLVLTVYRPDSAVATTYRICRGDSVQLAGVQLAPGTFRWTPAATLSTDSVANPWAAPDTTTTYVATGTRPGTTQQVRWAVTVEVRPRLLAAAAVVALGGGPATGLTAPVAVQFLNPSSAPAGTGWRWRFGDGSAPDTARAPQHTFARGGTFVIWLRATSAAACNPLDSTQVTLILNQPDSVTTAAFSICRGDSVQLAGVVLQPGTFQWTPAGSLSDSLALAPWAAPDTTTTYTVSGLLPGSGQRLEWRVTVGVAPRLRVVATATAPGGGPATGQAAPATVQLGNLSPAPGGTRWQWRFGDGSAPDTARAPQHTFARAGTFRVVLTGRNPLTCNLLDSAALLLTVTPPDTTASRTLSICPGDSVQLPGGLLEPGTFRWTPDSTLSAGSLPAPWAAPRITTTYTATGTYAGQARRLTLVVTVTVTPPVAPAWTVAAQQCLPAGSRVTFELAPPLPRDGIWEFGDGATAPLADATVAHTYALPAGGQEFVVGFRGHTAAGCPVAAQQPVRTEALYLTNILTPGLADGLNDALTIPCFQPGTATLTVYNRWGQVVYDSGPNAYANDWRAPGLAAGTYYYQLRLTYAPTPYRGWVEVVR